MIFQIALQVLVQSFIQFYYNDKILSFLFLVDFLNWKKLVEKKYFLCGPCEYEGC